MEVKTFSESELSGREKYRRNANNPYEFTEDPYAPWDVSSTGKVHTYNTEIKDRDIPYTKYEKEGYWLEKIKYDALIKAYKETGSLPIYLNYFQDGIGFWWNLLNVQPEWEWRWATDTTANGTYGQKKVKKLVTFVFPKDGKQFNYE